MRKSIIYVSDVSEDILCVMSAMGFIERDFNIFRYGIYANFSSQGHF